MSPAATLVAQPRFQRQVRTVHAAGPRVVAELLAELAHVTDSADVLDALLRRYAGLVPVQLDIAGAGSFPPRPLRRAA